MKSLRQVLAAASVALGAAGCAPSAAPPDLAAFYAESAAFEAEPRRPVITIPGTLGSRLVDGPTGRVIWGGEDALSIDPDDALAIEQIALPVGDGATPLRALRDGMRTDGVVRQANASLLGAVISLDIYGGIIRTLIAGGYDFRATRAAELSDRTINLDAFEFPYDWRRDIVEAAQDLDYFIERKRAQVMAERVRVYGPETAATQEPVKFDLVAHSMGALVARYYLMYGAQDLPADGGLPPLTWAGADHVAVAVLIAPPNAGSVLSVESLVNGRRFGPLQPFYEPTLLGTHPSLYQLLPRTRHQRVRLGPQGPGVDLFDAAVWERFGWGLAGPGADPLLATLLPEIPDPAQRRRNARAHLALMLSRAEQFHRAMDREARYPPGLDVYHVVGGGFRTPAGATVDAATGAVALTGFEEGDGVVLRSSSLLDERVGGAAAASQRRRGPISGERSTLFLPSEHVELTQNPVFGDNLLYWLLEGERAQVELLSPDDPGPAALMQKVLGGARDILAPR